MRVLLIAPYRESEAGHREDFLPSMALVFLAGFIRDQGHEPVLLDLNNAVTHAQEDPKAYAVNRILETVMETSPGLMARRSSSTIRIFRLRSAACTRPPIRTKSSLTAPTSTTSPWAKAKPSSSP